MNFGWLGEINLQCTLDKLLDGGFGCGCPPKDAERKARDTKLLKQLNALTKRSMAEVLALYDIALLKKALSWQAVRREILCRGTDRALVERIRRLC